MRRQPRKFFGLCLTIPDGVIMEDRLTGLDVVGTRTERSSRMLARLGPVPA